MSPAVTYVLIGWFAILSLIVSAIDSFWSFVLLLTPNNPPIENAGNSPYVLITSNNGLNFLVDCALITNSPSLKRAGIESDVDEPGPEIYPPSA